jgi:type II restriction/modification system DNA methylase subunit YeeA
VRYLVENSLGRLWMLNRPNSRLVEQMDYYIKPAPAADGSEQPETDFLRINKPEEIKICDPACGSGHMLTYAFDLLYAIYEEEGYETADIPTLILTHNLYGIEIDERAGELAAFALTMKARAKQRRFFRNAVQPHICVLENVHFDEGELNEYMDVIGRDLFTDELRETLGQFEQANNFGSLIVPKLRDPAETLRMVEARDFAGDLLLNDVQERVVAVLSMAEALSPKYHMVIANPPYMGGKGMNESLSKFLSENFQAGKTDLMTAFILRGNSLAKNSGRLAAVTLDSWMFLSTYEKLRSVVFSDHDIASMVHVGWNCFPDGHLYNRGTAFVFRKRVEGQKGIFIGLDDLPAIEDRENAFLERITSRKNVFLKDTKDFEEIPGAPITYWISEKTLNIIRENESIGKYAETKVGLQTGDNDQFLRQWSEVDFSNIGLNLSQETAKKADCKWFPCNKGGDFRKWYGNHEYVVNWQNDGKRLRSFTDHKGKLRSRPQNTAYYFREAISWSDVTSFSNSFRYFPEGFINDATGHSAFGGDENWKFSLMAYCNGKFANKLAKLINPTIHFHIGYFNKLPYAESAFNATSVKCARRATELSKSDWDAYETSWDFTTLPLLHSDCRAQTLKSSYANLRASWQSMTHEMQRLEEENNRIFIDAYGLQDELTPEVPLEEITLSCNPAYRYGLKNDAETNETRLRADTMAEFLSYAVGCMFGRYALDKPGLILANQGETIEDYLKQIPEPSFPADDDNVIPMLDGDWFTDDIAERFREFLRITFGEKRYEENLRFVEQALGKDIRKYFLKDFYNDHVRRYKKRPIYWLFSSPKGSFNALIYMHRYRPDTVSVVLNDYLREFRTKLTSRRDHLEAVSISANSSSAEKTKAIKDIEKISKIIVELADYERDVLYPLATRQVEIDLDDGVKVNYPKFGDALKKITGLS